MPRAGLAVLILELRQMAEAGDAEYTLAGETYWTDDHLAAVLDKHRYNVVREPVQPVVEYNGGTQEYFDYYFSQLNPERADSGATAWELATSEGSAFGTADYTVNYDARHIRFPTSTDGATYYLTYRTFDLNRAAAEVWSRKAANVANRFDVSTDNHSLKRGQLRQAYLDMAAEYRRRAGGRTRTMVRSDVNG